MSRRCGVGRDAVRDMAVDAYGYGASWARANPLVGPAPAVATVAAADMGRACTRAVAALTLFNAAANVGGGATVQGEALEVARGRLDALAPPAANTDKWRDTAALLLVTLLLLLLLLLLEADG